MQSTFKFKSLIAIVFAFYTQFTFQAVAVLASDHADPLFLQKQEGGITDLFGYVKDGSENLTLIICVRRGLIKDEPTPLLPYTYRLHIDLTSKIDFSDDVQGTLARYGGHVLKPSEIEEEISFEIKLNDAPVKNWRPEFSDTNDEYLSKTLLRKLEVKGLEQDQFRIWAGVRDDPFILHSFSRTNCVAMVIEIPLANFPGNQTDFVIWATSEGFGKQIDHVGRSLRTMLPRLGFLNTLPPREHVAEITKRDKSPGPIADVLAFAIPPLFGIRSYDFEPDVMILTLRDDILLDGELYPQTYPNGRRLTDDIAKLCSIQGDSLLYDVSLADAHHDNFPRPDSDNVDFLETFPYLAPPLKCTVAVREPSLRIQTLVILVAVAAAVILFQISLLYFTIRYFRLKKHFRARGLTTSSSILPSGE
ncbi:MAG: hypothetical protein AAF483_09315 [Planctomycetota bacterium]